MTIGNKELLLRGLVFTLVLVSVGLLGSCQKASQTSDDNAVKEPNDNSISLTAAAAYEAAREGGMQQSMSTSMSNTYIRITQPHSGQRIRRGTRVSIQAESPNKNEVRNAIFFVNGRRIGVSSGYPFRTSWWARERGQYVIVVEATKRGGKKVSHSASIVVE